MKCNICGNLPADCVAIGCRADAAPLASPVAVSIAPAANIVIRIDVDAGTARTIWNDVLDLPSLGRLSITRATSIEFSEADQAWRIETPDGRQIGGFFKKRSDALAYEARWAAGEVLAGR